ncbi:WD40-repeat-containing domain protein [Chaetomidium leptoderma]|uniref:WD40-repeat-containing domain protein n=1 Tax=Chaetomidium leptoderma TaxID=669021 RepID=A0AAN6VCF2_9PEZI|nr:WD40-repeat-containing domain protein [Chaetomidium leptoderma]
MKPLPHRLVSTPGAIANSSKNPIAVHAEKPKSTGGVKDPRLLASGSDDETVKIWDPATGQCVSTLKGHASDFSVWSVAWSHDATRLASGSGDKTVKIWDPGTGQCVSTLKGHASNVRSLAWSHL